MARLPDNPVERQKIIETRKAQAKRLEQYVAQTGTGSVHNMINSLGQNSYYDMFRKMIMGKRNFSPDFLDDLKKHAPNLNFRWLLTGEGYMLASDQKNLVGPIDTHTPISIAAEPTPRTYTNEYVVQDNSMAPTILKGDVLTFAVLGQSEQPVFGELFIIQTTTAKFVRVLWLEGDKYLLCPYDKARTPEITIAKSEVISIHPVIKMTRNL